MAVNNQAITDKYAIFNGDCIEGMMELPSDSDHLSIYSPPFGGLYTYSSNERDLSNCVDYAEFMTMYGFVIKELHRITMPGRISLVHCTDIPKSNSGTDALIDFPGAIVSAHEAAGWNYCGRRYIFKEPLAVRLRTMQKNLAHASLVADSVDCGIASADILLTFRKRGENPVPVGHPVGMLEYAGEREVPHELHQYRGWTGNQIENRYSHWIWRNYASSCWDDIRLHRVLPYKAARDKDDEKHVHPLQLDVIERGVQLYSNPGETVLTPFMGVGSEVYMPVMLGRRGIGFELKQSYYNQAVKNVELAAKNIKCDSDNLELIFDTEDAA
jgi:DNA modification methylase